MSPDGKFAAIVVGNGSATVTTTRQLQHVFGKLVIFTVARGKLDHITDAQLGHACQGAVWSDDGKRLLVQCSVERDIRTFDFDGKALTERARSGAARWYRAPAPWSRPNAALDFALDRRAPWHRT